MVSRSVRRMNVARTKNQQPITNTLANNASLPNSQNIAQFQLSNGIRVLAYENFASPAVIINGYLMAGALDESDPTKRGLAGFVSDCLTRGTQRFSYEQIFEQTGPGRSENGSIP